MRLNKDLFSTHPMLGMTFGKILDYLVFYLKVSKSKSKVGVLMTHKNI